MKDSYRVILLLSLAAHQSSHAFLQRIHAPTKFNLSDGIHLLYIVLMFDPKAISDLAISQFTAAIQSIPTEEKNRLKAWASAVREIQSSSESDSEKIQKLESLHAPALIYDVFKSYIASFAESKSISNKTTVKSILDTAQYLVRPRLIVLASAIGIGLNKILPHILIRSETAAFIVQLEQLLE